MKIIRPLLLVVSMLVVAVLHGCAGSEPSPSQLKGIDLYVQAVDAYHKGDRASAIAKLSTATQQNPNLLMAQSMLGDLYREQGAYSQALPHYETLATLDPYGSTTNYRLGLTNQFLNRLQQAV